MLWAVFLTGWGPSSSSSSSSSSSGDDGASLWCSPVLEGGRGSLLGDWYTRCGGMAMFLSVSCWAGVSVFRTLSEKLGRMWPRTGGTSVSRESEEGLMLADSCCGRGLWGSSPTYWCDWPGQGWAGANWGANMSPKGRDSVGDGPWNWRFQLGSGTKAGERSRG